MPVKPCPRLVGGLVRGGRGARSAAADRSRSSACGRRSSGGTGAAACPARARSAARRRSSGDLLPDSRSGRRARLGRLAQRRDRAAASRARTAGRRSGSARARGRRAGGCAAWGSARRRCARAPPSSARARRGTRAGGSSSGPAPRSASPGSRRCRRPRSPSSPVPPSEGLHRPRHRVGVADEVADDLVLAAQDRQRLRQLAQRGVRAADHPVQLLGPPGQPGPELVEDQPEALALGAAHHGR